MKLVKSTNPHSLQSVVTKLRTAIEEYLSEVDNPCPDYVQRKMLRDRLRRVLKETAP